MAKDYAKDFYNSSAWRRTQAAYMASQSGVCERCGGLARIVHHKNYITPQNIHDPAITLDWTNLEALCIDCHNAEHISGGVWVLGLTFGSGGELLQMQITPPGPGLTGPSL